MSGWDTHNGRAVCLPIDNIDTDQLIPARFMSQPRANGYGHLLLHDLRLDAEEQPERTFILNRVPDASVLITGRNFGCGSSREAAVYALLDAGIQIVVASGFGDIFVANAINNGLLPARVSEQDANCILGIIGHDSAEASASLKTQTLLIDTKTADYSCNFIIDDSHRTKLINGWDDIDLTLKHSEVIDAFRHERARQHNWVFKLGN